MVPCTGTSVDVAIDVEEVSSSHSIEMTAFLGQFIHQLMQLAGYILSLVIG